MKDYYEILGVDKNASASDIKKAYRKLSKLHHPDANDSSDDEEFKKISEAYNVLSDVNKRAKYDNQGGSDMFDSFFGGFGGFGFNQSQQQNFRGRNLNLTYSISLDDVASGEPKTIRYKRKVKCHSCNGHGGDDIQNCSSCNGHGKIRQVQRTPFGVIEQVTVCSSCGGTGKVPKNICTICNGASVVDKSEEITIDVSNVIGGNLYKYSNKGDETSRGYAGDLILEIRYAPHTKFKVNNHNLTADIYIPFTTMVLGGQVEFMILNGKSHNINIPPMSKPMQNFRLQGLGLPNGQGGKGDIIITVQLDFPSEVGDEDKELIQKLSNSPNFIYTKK